MSTRTRSFIASLAVMAAFCFAVFGGTAQASDGAFVVNHGQQVGDNCSATVGTDLYVGFITHLVITPSGKFSIGCILRGPSVASQENFNGLQIAPSGMALLSENGVL
jgi:hypothetical protein